MPDLQCRPEGRDIQGAQELSPEYRGCGNLLSAFHDELTLPLPALLPDRSADSSTPRGIHNETGDTARILLKSCDNVMELQLGGRPRCEASA